MSTRFRVVVVGGGYAGALAAARLVRDSSIDVTLVAPNAQLTHRVRLYRALARRPDPQVSMPLRRLVGPQVRILDAWVDAVDADTRRVRTSAGDLPYDALIVATGSAGCSTPAHASQSANVPMVVEANAASLRHFREALPRLESRASAVLANALPSSGRSDGRVEVGPTLQLADYPEVFVVGDAAAVRIRAGVVPMRCKTAMPMAAHAADCILALRAGRPASDFACEDPGTVVALGGSSALYVAPDAAGAGRTLHGLVIGGVKWLLCWYVVLSIRLESSGWFHYRWQKRAGCSASLKGGARASSPA